MARFACATWRPIGANTGGRLSPNLGLILHHAVANESLFTFFNSPSAQVSAHFWVAKDGRIEQYVDTDVVAWHGRNLNGRYVGVETEGCGPAPHAEPMTPAMLDAMVRLYADSKKARDLESMGFPLLPWHKRLIHYSHLFEEKIMNLQVKLSLEEALDLGWQILFECFDREQTKIKKSILDKYWPKETAKL